MEAVKRVTDSSEQQRDLARELFAPGLSDIQLEAWRYYNLGLNVFPLYPGGKRTIYKWGKLQNTRLPESHLTRCFMVPDCNIAAMTGRTSGGFAVIDPDGNQEITDMIMKHLKGIGKPVWAVLTPRGNGSAHFYFRIEEGVLENAKYMLSGTGLIKTTGVGEVDIIGHDKYALLPPSFNQKYGRRYTWLRKDRESEGIPVYSLEDLLPLLPNLQLLNRKTTGKGYGQTALEQECAAVAATQIGNRNRQLIKSARHIGQLVGAGVIDRDEAEEALIQAGLESGLKWKEAADAVYSALDFGEASPRELKKNFQAFGRAEEGDRLFSWIITTDWTQFGRSATTVKRTAEALAMLAYNAKKGKWRATVRELQVVGRLSDRTVQKALRKLVAVGAIEKVDRLIRYKASEGEKKYQPSFWKLGNSALAIDLLDSDSISSYKRTIEGVEGESENTTESTLICMNVVNSDSNKNNKPLAHDAAETKALGKTGWQVWKYLSEQAEPKTPKQIAEALNLTKGQVSYALSKVSKKTEGRPFLINQDGRWTASEATERELREEIAVVYGTDGKGQERITKFREQYATYVAEYIVLEEVKRWPVAHKHDETLEAVFTVPIKEDSLPEYERIETEETEEQDNGW